MTDEDFRAQIETNLFGVVNVTKAALPILRKQRSGHFIQFSSIGGRVGGTPGLGAYQTAKFAVEGFSEVLNNEVKPFGVKVTIIEPGAFRTDWQGSSMDMARVGEDYEETVGAIHRLRGSTDGNSRAIRRARPGSSGISRRWTGRRCGCCSARARWRWPRRRPRRARRKRGSGPTSADRRIFPPKSCPDCPRADIRGRMGALQRKKKPGRCMLARRLRLFVCLLGLNVVNFEQLVQHHIGRDDAAGRIPDGVAHAVSLFVLDGGEALP